MFLLTLSVCLTAMTSETLEDVFLRCGIDSNLSNALMMEGWTASTFRMAAVDLHSFEDVLGEWSNAHSLSVFQKACLRNAFQSLQPQSSASVSPGPVSASTPASVSGSWTESFPPKLEQSMIQSMKQKIMVNYPS